MKIVTIARQGREEAKLEQVCANVDRIVELMCIVTMVVI